MFWKYLLISIISTGLSILTFGWSLIISVCTFLFTLLVLPIIVSVCKHGITEAIALFLIFASFYYVFMWVTQ